MDFEKMASAAGDKPAEEITENSIIREVREFVADKKRKTLAEFDEAEKLLGIQGGGLGALLRPNKTPEGQEDKGGITAGDDPLSNYTGGDKK